MFSKIGVYIIACIMLFVSTFGAFGAPPISFPNEHDFKEDEPTESIIEYHLPPQTKTTIIEPVLLPWKQQSTDLLEWWITVEYEGKTFEQKVPIGITDFRNRFLKHPDYGEIIRFNVDDDPNDDVEIIVGVYWAVILDINGNQVKSLEQRCRVRLLNEGDYLSNEYAELEVWSDLQLNYGLFKQTSSKPHEINPVVATLHQIIERFFGCNDHFRFFDSIFKEQATHPVISMANDADNIQMGAGFRSPAGEKTPLYIDKRFSFARESIFSPTLFQHILDPSSSTGETSLDMLYGFRSYKASQSTPSFDIGFSIGFNPILYLKSKFIPKQGFLYYFFNEQSQQDKATSITFTSAIERGSGESLSLQLLFDKIKNNLAKTGRWMSFDLDILGDNNLLAGSFHYTASHPFNINFTINSPFFEEKMQLANIPTEIDISWDLDIALTLPPNLFASANGFVDINMNDDLGLLRLYYPDTSFFNGNNIFIDLPQGLPRSTRMEAEATISLDLLDFSDPNNFISGRILHECSQDIAVIDAYLPEIDADIGPFDSPIIHAIDLPSYAEAKGKLHWNNLEGYAQIVRGTSHSIDPVELTLSYGNLSLFNRLELKDGYIDTNFKLDENGYFHFDTSHDVMGTTLSVSNTDTGNSLGLSVAEVSADDFQAQWNLDTSSSALSIPQISFQGMVNRLQDLQLNLNYGGKQTDLLLDWTLQQQGSFMIDIDQETPLSLDFDQFGLNSNEFQLGGGITIAEDIAFDMSWDLKQGEEQGGSVDPGRFSVNENNAEINLEEFDFFILFQNQYGINITLENVQFYLDFEWWKGDRLLPYCWLDYEVNNDAFDIDLLWTNAEGNTQWYSSMEDW